MAFEKIGTQFEKKHPNIRINFNFSGSNILQKQIEMGASVDVFASAAEMHMNMLEKNGFIVNAMRKNFATNQIVIITPKNVDVTKNSFLYLNSSSCKKIAVGAQNVPVRLYAEEILRYLNLWDENRSKFVYGQNARHVLEYVIRNEVDAGLVYLSDATLFGEELTILAKAESGWIKKMMYPIAVLSHSDHKSDASQFVNFVLNQESQNVLHSFGFNSPNN